MAEVRSFQHQYINGEWVESTNAPKTLDVINSNTAQVIATVPDGSKKDAEKAILAARAAFASWSTTPLVARKEYIKKFMEAHKRRRAETIGWLTKELGCTAALAESLQANFVEMHGTTLLGAIDGVNWYEAVGKVTVVKEPVGVIGAITPWNYPLNQIALKVIPALLAGCTVVLKPSKVTPCCAIIVAEAGKLQEAMHEAGVPPGVFNMVVGHECGEVLSSHPEVDLVSFTGSARAGRQISAAAAQSLKQVRTELGGKSAAILLDDADLQTVVPQFVAQLMNNSGQSCNALSRMIVPESKYNEVIDIAKRVAENTVVGRSDDPKADIGPLVSQVQWDQVQSFMQKGMDEGARLITGGPGKPAGLEGGFFAKPTILADVSNQMTIAREEIFGPVLSIIPYSSEAEAIDVANDTIYGLNNAVASSSMKRCIQVGSKLRSGMVMINGTYMDWEAPFGGYKQSGNAREWGLAGLDEFLVTKTINVTAKDYEEAMCPAASPKHVNLNTALLDLVVACNTSGPGGAGL
ncbi:unnamed protein product [Polarella glacialis]|uniref:Aldehyde dehydrogenase domain-containing protein n=1 Tax=Polarella glacialis TaxID=89957 RepID=A0A813GJC4_POLGL|nr:unnamed protein product [Polarella glacialis]